MTTVNLEDAQASASTDGNRPLLEVTDLSTTFETPRGPLRAVDTVSFSVPLGRRVGIVGESGSGKSVLARSIMGLSGRRGGQSEGSVVFEGRELTTLSLKDLRRMWGSDVAMVFQDPMTSLNPVVRIGRQVTESLLTHLEISKDEAKERAVELLRSVGIPEPERRMREYPHQLSGGMRQRVVIAIALSCSPRLLLADEPTTALDVTIEAQVLDLLETAQRERNMTLVLITHNLGVVANHTDEIIVMYAGRIVERAPTRVLFRNMHMPYTEALMRSIPKVNEPSHTRLEAIPGRPPDLVVQTSGCRFAPRCRYVQDRCRAEEPPLVAAENPDHTYRCWFPLNMTAAASAAVDQTVEAQ